MSDRPVLAPDDLNWHDGNLIEIRAMGLAAGASTLELVTDLYDAAEPSGDRVRFVCRARGLVFFRSGLDAGRLSDHSRAGNIHYCHLIEEGDRAYLSLMLFGGGIEICAKTFELERAGT